jgi:large subunit ribosomal protein L5e
MVCVESHMTKAYFKRLQSSTGTAGKTEYVARICVTTQDKNKYNTPKHRYVVQFTNKDIVAQITYATLAGDIVLTAAYAHELPHYGLKCGFTNYAAVMCSVCQSKIIFESNWSK